MYQFPLIESKKELHQKEVVASEIFSNLFPRSATISLFNSKKIVHKLSHQHLHTQFWIVKTSTANGVNTTWKSVKEFPVPVLIANFLEEYTKQEVQSIKY